MLQGFLNVIPKIFSSPRSLTVAEPPSDVAVQVQSEDVGTVVNSKLLVVVAVRNGALDEPVREVQAASAHSESRYDARRRRQKLPSLFQSRLFFINGYIQQNPSFQFRNSADQIKQSLKHLEPNQQKVPHDKREQDYSVQSRASNILKDKFRRLEPTLNQINARCVRLCRRIGQFESAKTHQLVSSSPSHLLSSLSSHLSPMSSKIEQVVTDFLTTGAKCHVIPCIDMLDGSAEPSPRESVPVPESSPCSDDRNPFELASLWGRFSAQSLNAAASERQGEVREIDISAKDAKDADAVDTSKLEHENYGEGSIRSVGPEAGDDSDSSRVARAGDGAEKNVANVPSSGQRQSVRGRKLLARYVGVLMSPQEDVAKKNQPLKKSSAVQKQPKKTVLAGSTNQAPIIVTIKDLDQLYNDFIKGQVVEDDGSPKLVLSSSNQDSTAHGLFRGEMPVGFGEEVRS
jgi:hypothetical protein